MLLRISWKQTGMSSIRAKGPVCILLGKHYIPISKAFIDEPVRNFAASQVLNVGGAVFDHFTTKQEAYDAFDRAVRARRVQTL
jgi:hypothetical protein